MLAWLACIRMLGIIFALKLSLVNAQDVSFTVPSTWRKASSNLTLTQRNALAGAVVDSMRPQFNVSTGLVNGLRLADCCSLFEAISWLDYLNSTRNYEDLVLSNFNTAINQRKPVYSTQTLNSDTVALGLAAFQAWQAYGDSGALDLATTLWDYLYGFFVQPSDAEKGAHVTRSVSLNSTCNGTTIAGGVFYRVGNTTTDTVVNTETIGPFTALSSYLFEATGNTTYSSAAELSAEFIWSHLFNGTIVFDGISLAGCENANPSAMLSYNSGTTMEAFASISRWNSSWTPRLNALVSSATQFPVWTSADGINSEDNDPVNEILQYNVLHPLKAFMIRGLYATWNSSETQSNMADYIEAYVNVQMNALLDLASTPNSNLYSSNWHGPPVGTLVPWGQLPALEVFKAAVGFAIGSQPSPATPPGPSPTAAAASGAAGLSKGAVAGIAVGACAMLLGVIALVLFCMRYKKRHQEEKVRQLLEFAPVPYQAPRARSDTVSTAPTGAIQSLVQVRPPTGKFRATIRDPLSLQVLPMTQVASPGVPITVPTLPSSPDELMPGSSIEPPSTLIIPSSKSASHAHGSPPSAPSAHTSTPAASPEGAASPIHASTDAIVASSPQDRGRDDADLAAVQGLLSQLNRALARLPPGGLEGEEPPEYGA